jgi:hypothetical protein
MKIVSTFLATAVAMENSPKRNIAGNIETLLPHISDIGAQHKGPKANPRLLVDIISIKFDKDLPGATYI